MNALLMDAAVNSPFFYERCIIITVMLPYMQASLVLSILNIQSRYKVKPSTVNLEGDHQRGNIV